MMQKIERVEPIERGLFKYKNAIDIATLFSEDNIRITLYNLFAGVINKQVEINEDVSTLPLFVLHEKNFDGSISINLEYNAFIYSLGAMFDDETREIFIKNYKLDGSNLRRKSLVRMNYSLLNFIEYSTDILYINSMVGDKVYIKFYNPIIYSYKEQEPIQMSCIFFNYLRVKELINGLKNSDKLLDQIEYILALTYDNLKLLAFGSKLCNSFWESGKKSKKVLLAL